MSWKIEHRPSQDIVTITAEGAISAEDVFAQVDESVALVKATFALGSLVDYSNAVLGMPVADISRLPDMFTAQGLPRRTKIAVVLPADPENMHKYTFFDDVASNNGYRVKLFWEPTRAMAWLSDG